MVQFNSDYWNSMDNKKVEKIELGTKDIGISMGIGDPWLNLKSAVTAGANHVELGFMGVGKGSINQPGSVTPDTIGKDKREDIRQMAKINNVTLSTHASANVMGFAGLDRNKFDKAKAAEAVNEVKRAVDFAAETAQGGPVVIHTGEYPRSICETGKEFEAYKGEEEKAMLGLVDERNGEVKAAITRDLTVPVLKKEMVDGREVPVVDKNGNFVYKEWGYKDFVEQAKKRNIPAEKLFLKEYMEKQRLKASSEEKRWSLMHQEYQKQQQEIQHMIDSVEELSRKDKEKANKVAKVYAEQIGASPSGMDMMERERFRKDPLSFIKKKSHFVGKEVQQAMENVEAAGRERVEIEKQVGTDEKEGTIKTLNEYATKESANNMADLAMYAMEVEKKKKLKNPLYIAPENVFCESYGGHPQELKTLIQNARKSMAEKLLAKKKASSQSEAEKIAAEKIKATFDIAHANIWRRYFQGDDKQFRRWFKNQVKDLIKNDIIGHVHIADNFGYSDEHLSPGQGNTPIDEFMEEFKKSGIKDKIIIEPGAQGEGESIYSSMFGAWARAASSPMYRVGNVSKSWTDIEGSYFGRTFTPSYMAGGYLVNPKAEDNWWSGVPLE